MHRLHLLGLSIGLALGLYCIQVGRDQAQQTPASPVPTAFYAP